MPVVLQYAAVHHILRQICTAFLNVQEEVLPDIMQEKVYLQGPDRHGRGVCVLQVCLLAVLSVLVFCRLAAWWHAFALLSCCNWSAC